MGIQPQEKLSAATISICYSTLVRYPSLSKLMGRTDVRSQRLSIVGVVTAGMVIMVGQCCGDIQCASFLRKFGVIIGNFILVTTSVAGTEVVTDKSSLPLFVCSAGVPIPHTALYPVSKFVRTLCQLGNEGFQIEYLLPRSRSFILLCIIEILSILP